MPRPWNKLRNLGPHGIKADEMFGSIGEIVKRGGTLKTTSPSGEETCELIPPLAKKMLPNNLKLRYFLYTLAIDPIYQIGSEVDPSKRVATKALEICEQIARLNSSYNIPRSYDERKRDAIIQVVEQRKKDVLSESLGQVVAVPQNVLRFLKENRLLAKSPRNSHRQRIAAIKQCFFGSPAPVFPSLSFRHLRFPLDDIRG